MKGIIFASLLLSCLTACKSKSKTAFDYNQEIVKKENSLVPYINKTETDVAKYAELAQYDSIGAAGEKMEKMIDEKILEIKQQPAPEVNGGEKIKQAVLKYFEFIKSLYTAYKNFGYGKTPELKAAELKKVEQIVSRKDKVVADLRAAQREYVAANNIQIKK